MSIKLITLNVEGDKHIHRFLPVLKDLNPDVVCFQELFEVDAPFIANELGMVTSKYVPTMSISQENKYGFNLKGNWGIGIMTKLEVKESQVFQYGPFSELKVFQQPNDDIRSVIISTLSDGKNDYRIATTHFTWSPAGNITDAQREDFVRLKAILIQYEDLVLCGDFNAPRGREMFSLFEGLYKDNVPKEITTTIDKNLHYAGDKNLQLVVDSIFTTPHYQVKNVQVLNGVSDHMGIYGEIVKA